MDRRELNKPNVFNMLMSSRTVTSIVQSHRPLGPFCFYFKIPMFFFQVPGHVEIIRLTAAITRAEEVLTLTSQQSADVEVDGLRWCVWEII